MILYGSDVYTLFTLYVMRATRRRTGTPRWRRRCSTARASRSTGSAGAATRPSACWAAAWPTASPAGSSRSPPSSTPRARAAPAVGCAAPCRGRCCAAPHAQPCPLFVSHAPLSITPGSAPRQAHRDGDAARRAWAHGGRRALHPRRVVTRLTCRDQRALSQRCSVRPCLRVCCGLWSAVKYEPSRKIPYHHYSLKPYSFHLQTGRSNIITVPKGGGETG